MVKLDMDADFQFDNTWTLHPIDGDTGKTYMGIRDAEKVFVKRNTTPFLAALSREGIVPKLVWTRRTGNGDILTAQEWLEGKTFLPEEVGQSLEVIQILSHLHHSVSLKRMLVRVGGKQKSPFDFLKSYAHQMPSDLKNNQYLHSVFRYLEDHLPEETTFKVCHGDPVNTNWFMATDDRLYLVDWDSCVLSDPAYDLGILLGRHVPYGKWQRWLELYGENPTEELLEKIYWYSGMDFLLRIKQYHQRFEYPKMNQEIMMLKKLYLY